MALQELDLTIVHRSGKHNFIADALSRCPLPDSTDHHPTEEVVAAITRRAARAETEDGEERLAVLQHQVEELAPIIEFQQDGVLPQEEKFAQRIALTSSQYTVLDGVLYRVAPDATLRLIPPRSLRERLIGEVHGGRFGAHLSDVKVYSELRKHYWWPGMRGNVTQ